MQYAVPMPPCMYGHGHVMWPQPPVAQPWYEMPPPQMPQEEIDDGYQLWRRAVGGAVEAEAEITYGIVEEKKKKKKKKKSKKGKGKGKKAVDSVSCTRSRSASPGRCAEAEQSRRSSSCPPSWRVEITCKPAIPDPFAALARKDISAQPVGEEGSLRLGGNQLHPMRHILSSCFE